MWGIKGNDDDKNIKLIVLGFPTKTHVFAWQDGVYVTFNDNTMDTSSATIHVGRLKDNSIVQITPTLIKRIVNKKVFPLNI